METYKYSININQNAAIELGLDVDIIDLAIFDYIKDFVNSKKCETIVTESGVYFWVSHKNIIDNMPLLNITTTRGIAKRVDKLINAGLLIKYSRCDQVSRTYYTFGEKYDEYLFVRTQEQKFEGGGINIQGNINIIENNSNNSPITDSPTMNSSPINSPIITETPLSPKRGNQKLGLDLSFIVASFRPAIDIWLEYKKERKQSYKQKGLEALYHKLVNLSDGDPHTAMLIVEQSMANNYQGLFELKGCNNGNTTSRPTDAQLLRAAIDQSWGPGGDPLADIL